jgi:hypothetical protein
LGVSKQYETTVESVDALLDRKELAARWSCSTETIKRRQADGSLKATFLPGGRLVRYRLRDVLKAEGSL